MKKLDCKDYYYLEKTLYVLRTIGGAFGIAGVLGIIFIIPSVIEKMVGSFFKCFGAATLLFLAFSAVIYAGYLLYKYSKLSRQILDEREEQDIIKLFQVEDNAVSIDRRLNFEIILKNTK